MTGLEFKVLCRIVLYGTLVLSPLFTFLAICSGMIIVNGGLMALQLAWCSAGLGYVGFDSLMRDLPIWQAFEDDAKRK